MPPKMTRQHSSNPFFSFRFLAQHTGCTWGRVPEWLWRLERRSHPHAWKSIRCRWPIPSPRCSPCPATHGLMARHRLEWPDCVGPRGRIVGMSSRADVRPSADGAVPGAGLLSNGRLVQKRSRPAPCRRAGTSAPFAFVIFDVFAAQSPISSSPDTCDSKLSSPKK